MKTNDDADAELDPVRQLLLQLVRQQGTDLKTVSLAIDKNHAYLQQFVKMRVPKHLSDTVREALGNYFGVDPERFRSGAPRPRRQQPQGPNPVLLARAMRFTDRVLEDLPVDEAQRSQLASEVASSVYVLLDRQLLADRDETVGVVKSMIEGILSTVMPREEPTAD